MIDLMTPEIAAEYLARHDQDARTLTRKTKRELTGLRTARLRAQNVIVISGGPWSKDELVNDLLERDYPIDRLNEAIHVSYHHDGDGGGGSSACEYCHPHDGGRCDCSPKALEALEARAQS
jgi:hypothetical protein